MVPWKFGADARLLLPVGGVDRGAADGSAGIALRVLEGQLDARADEVGLRAVELHDRVHLVVVECLRPQAHPRALDADQVQAVRTDVRLLDVDQLPLVGIEPAEVVDLRIAARLCRQDEQHGGKKHISHEIAPG